MNSYELERIKNRELVNGVMYIYAEDVREITKLGRTTIYQLIKDGKFPKPIEIKRYWGEGKKFHLWKSWDIYNWMQAMADQRKEETEK